MLNLFVLDADGSKVPVYVSEASPDDFHATERWQTQWTSKAALEMPNKVHFAALLKMDMMESWCLRRKHLIKDFERSD